MTKLQKEEVRGVGAGLAGKGETEAVSVPECSARLVPRDWIHASNVAKRPIAEVHPLSATVRKNPLALQGFL